MALRLTFDGLRSLVHDLRARGVMPAFIAVSAFDKRDLKQELMANAVELDGVVSDEDVIGFIEGCMIVSHPDIARGRAYVMPAAETLDPARRLAVH